MDRNSSVLGAVIHYVEGDLYCLMVESHNEGVTTAAVVCRRPHRPKRTG